MYITVHYNIRLTPEEVPVYLALAKQFGLDYEEPTDKELLERLFREKGYAVTTLVTSQQ